MIIQRKSQIVNNQEMSSKMQNRMLQLVLDQVFKATCKLTTSWDRRSPSVVMVTPLLNLQEEA